MCIIHCMGALFLAVFNKILGSQPETDNIHPYKL